MQPEAFAKALLQSRCLLKRLLQKRETKKSFDNKIRQIVIQVESWKQRQVNW